MSERHKRKNARKLLSKMGYRSGGHLKSPSDEREDATMIKSAVRQHEDQEHGGKHAKIKLADGGHAEGMAPRRRSDKKSRDGKKAHTTVNVLVGGHGSPAPRPPLPVPVPVGGPIPPGGPPVGPPPGLPAGLAGAGGPPGPMGQKRGGRSGYRKGGRTTYPIDDGAGGGEGRLEKARAYGAKVRKGGRAK